MQLTHPDFRLLADVGGTNARFTMENPQGKWVDTEVLRCADYPDFAAAVQAYLTKVGRSMPAYAGVAIANPVHGDWIEMTNHHWRFSIEQTRRTLGLKQLIVANDFTALAMALPHLADDEKIQIGGQACSQRLPLGLLGAGTGLGVSGLLPIAEDRWVSLSSEGGHMSFAPNGPRERALLELVSQRYEHVSAERLISGTGLPLVYESLCQLDGQEPRPNLDGAAISTLAREQSEPYCKETLYLYSAMLGSMAGNIALMLGSLGGVYIGGGVTLNLGEQFDKKVFRERFENKGRFQNFLKKIPCYLITARYPAFIGMSAILRDALHEQSRHWPLCDKVEFMREQLAPAERLVADFVLMHPKDMMHQPISVIAQRVGVSEPTIIRFCRSMGFQGLSEFKLQLASGFVV
jgi:glucokinase